MIMIIMTYTLDKQQLCALGIMGYSRKLVYTAIYLSKYRTCHVVYVAIVQSYHLLSFFTEAMDSLQARPHLQ